MGAISVEVEELVADGRRNGRAPEGEAWLLDGIVTKRMRLNFKYACRCHKVGSVFADRLEESEHWKISPAISNTQDWMKPRHSMLPLL